MGTEANATEKEQPARTIRIALVDDHPLLVDGLRNLLDSLGGHEVVHVAHSGVEFLEGLKAHTSVDVAIVDLQMPGMDGFEVLERLREERPEIRAMAFSFSDESAWVRRATELGARAYVLKNTRRNVLRQVLADVVDRGFHNSELVAKSFAEKPAIAQGKTMDWSTVPPRELEFVRHLLAADDPTYEQIASLMGVGVHTVHGYFRWFNKHYNTHSRADLVRLVLLSPPPPRAERRMMLAA